jgi:multidrug resistance efflux pump
VDEAHVASRYGGRVIKLHAQEGDLLTPGSLIAELDAAELRARRDYLAALLAELEAGPRPNEIAAARHEWESLAAQLVSAQADARRARELFSEKTISESEMQNLVSHADALSESVTASKKRHDLLVEGTRPERIAQARAQLAEIGAQLSEMQITAPLEGKPPGEPQSARNATARQEPRPPSYTLETLSVKVGDVLPPNREVATLLFTGHLWVRVYVPEPWLAQIEVGQKVIVRADGTDRQFEGVVEQINRRAEFTPRNVQTVEDRVRQVFGIKIRLPTDTLLKAGMSVDVRFPKLP